MIADRVPLAFDADALRGDLAVIADDEWIRHFNTGIYEGDWSGVSLRSVGGRPDTLYPDPAAADPYADTGLDAGLLRGPLLEAGDGVVDAAGVDDHYLVEDAFARGQQTRQRLLLIACDQCEPEHGFKVFVVVEPRA